MRVLYPKKTVQIPQLGLSGKPARCVGLLHRTKERLWFISEDETEELSKNRTHMDQIFSLLGESHMAFCSKQNQKSHSLCPSAFLPLGLENRNTHREGDVNSSSGLINTESKRLGETSSLDALNLVFSCLSFVTFHRYLNSMQKAIAFLPLATYIVL